MMNFKFRKFILFILCLFLVVQVYPSFNLFRNTNLYLKPSFLLTKSINPSCEVEQLDMPNAFSPNGDGKNDAFCLNGWENCVDWFEVIIFNRLGEIIFESKQANFCWDGTFKGQVLESNIYLYVVRAKTKEGFEFKKSGNITLIR